MNKSTAAKGTKMSLLIVLSGPSGVGKGSIVKRLRELNPDIALAVSATTRLPRTGERDGIDYYFLLPADFKAAIAEASFLEWAEVFGNYYGTLKSEVERKLRLGHDVLLEIDTRGAAQIRESAMPYLSIFIMPPSLLELSRRIRGRGTESEASLTLRLAEAEAEMAQAAFYDYVIVNDQIEEAASRIMELIAAKKETEAQI